MPAVPGGRPARPAGRHRAGCPPRQRRGRAAVTARDHPVPAPAGLPLRQGRAARQHRPAAQPARGAFLFPRSPGRPPRDRGRRRPGGGRT